MTFQSIIGQSLSTAATNTGSGSASGLIGGTGGPIPYTFSCPSGTYIQSFNGRAARVIDGIQATCSDGSASAYYGGGGGDAWSEVSVTGYKGLNNARSQTLVDHLSFISGDNKIGPGYGRDGGYPVIWGGCENSLIDSISGHYGSMLDSIQFSCGYKIPPPPPPPVAYVPPPVAYVPPPVAYVPPPATHVPPPATHVPPPVAYIPPPKAPVNGGSGQSNIVPSIKAANTSTKTIIIILVILLMLILVITIAMFIYKKRQPATDNVEYM